MKPWIHENERKRATANIVTGCAVVLFTVLVYQFNELVIFMSRLFSILAPFILGLVVAFLLNPPQVFLEQQCHKWFDRFFKRKRPLLLYRLVTTVLLFAAFILFLVGFLSAVLPQLVGSIRNLIDSVTRYLYAHSTEIQSFLRDLNLNGTEGDNSFYNSIIKLWNDFASMSLTYTAQLVVGIVNVSASVGNVLSNVFVGLVVSINMMLGKERFAAQAKKLGCAFMNRERVELLSFWFRKTEHIFSRYIIGQIISSVVVGTLCYIFMLICNMDFALLISVMVGITNIIPVFGPIIGGFIGALILLISNPMSALGFGVFVLVMQQIEGNVISPRIMSDSIGISPFWVILSIILGGGLFGVGGILLSIPIFAIIYALVSAIVTARLEKKGFPGATSAYANDIPKPDEEKSKAKRCERTGEDAI